MTTRSLRPAVRTPGARRRHSARTRAQTDTTCSSGNQPAAIRVELVETAPMTGEEHQRALTVLATLINQWQHHHQTP
jgi:hypothetical protein